MPRSSLLWAAPLVVLCACADVSEPAGRGGRPGAAQASPAGDVDGGPAETTLICEMERPTGSNIAEKVCRPATEAEMQRLRTQDAVRARANVQKRPGG